MSSHGTNDLECAILATELEVIWGNCGKHIKDG